MSDDPKSKVISIETGQPYEPVPRLAEHEPDPDVADILAQLSELNDSGRIRGFVFLAWNPIEKRFMRASAMPLEGGLSNNCLNFLGALKLIECDLTYAVVEESDYFDGYEGDEA